MIGEGYIISSKNKTEKEFEKLPFDGEVSAPVEYKMETLIKFSNDTNRGLDSSITRLYKLVRRLGLEFNVADSKESIEPEGSYNILKTSLLDQHYRLNDLNNLINVLEEL